MAGYSSPLVLGYWYSSIRAAYKAYNPQLFGVV